MRGPLVSVDLSAIEYNYTLLAQKVGNIDKCAAVVKANAYGMGVEAVSKRLYKIGCRQFFVAYFCEAIELDDILKKHYGTNHQAVIYILHGLYDTDFSELLNRKHIIPLLNSYHDVENWRAKNQQDSQTYSLLYGLHFDTGINRLGIEIENTQKACQFLGELKSNCSLVMSHLACADEKNHPLNADQLKKFKSILKFFEGNNIKPCFANSSGIFLGANYHFDLVRPGAALYGISPQNKMDNPLKNAVTLFGNVIQIKPLLENETVGYGATYKAKKNGRMAVISMGYADGFFRALSNQWYGFYKSYKLPLIGRISMDLLAVDISEVPENELTHNMKIELYNSKNSVDNAANKIGTIGYEILTNLGLSSQKEYKN